MREEDENDALTEEERKAVKEALEDIRHGRVYTREDIRRMFGV